MTRKTLKNTLLAGAVIFMLPFSAMAADDSAAYKAEIGLLKQQIEQMQTSLKRLEASVKKVQSQAAPEITKAEVTALKKEVKAISKKAEDGWNTGNSATHMSGYGSVGFATGDADGSRFNQVQFSPIFHYQYKDIAMLEAELELEIEEDGDTGMEMEYLAIDLFLNDYVTLVAGKFLSPVGQFRQNYHPSWINKFPSAPVGFGHGGAAPMADIGLQARGGLPVSDDLKINYAAYVANGPELEVEDGEIEHIETEGFTRNPDGNFVFGGRIGFIPLPRLEIGISGVFGDVAVDDVGEPDRDYEIYGADIRYQYKDFDLRGEYVRHEVGSAATSAAPEGVKLQAWYLQGAYKLPQNFEGVVRYSNLDSPHGDDAQSQWALGLNYLFANNLIAKFGYEINDGRDDEATDEDRYLLQLAFGF